MPRDSAWRTSPTRRSQVSAGARPGPAAALGGRTSPAPPEALRLPSVAELLVFTFLSGLSRPPRFYAGQRMLPRLRPRGKVCVSAASLCAHAGAPSFPSSLLPAPSRPLRRWPRPRGPGSPAPSGAAAARGQIAERGAHPAPLAQANLEELRPQFAQRHSLSGAFSAPSLAPAGAVERRGGLPSPLGPLS